MAKFVYIFHSFQKQQRYAAKYISIMPALCLMLQIEYYAQNYAGIIRQTLPDMLTPILRSFDLFLREKENHYSILTERHSSRRSEKLYL